MKKIIVLVGLTLLIVGSLFANEQQLVGTWVSVHNSNQTMTFNANGTVIVQNIGFNIPGSANLFAPTHWAAAGEKIVLLIPNSHRSLRAFHISSDGRTLIIVRNVQDGNFEWWGTAFRRN